MVSSQKKRALASLFVTVLFVIALTPAPPLDAADHGDSPAVANDQGADIADSYIFLDPNDNSRVVIAGTIHGFIVPNEMVNFGVFDENIRYRFELEMTGDARPDRFVDIRFTPKNQSSSQVQTATITLPAGQTFDAPSTVPTLDPTPPAPVITTNQATGVQFFAGVVDDPFNFDITGFSRYTAPARAGTGPPDKSQLQRGRDSFAGYNILGIALSFPVSVLKSAGASNEIGLNFVTQRRSNQIVTRQAIVTGTGQWITVDRMATPAVNVALIPFNRKNEFNSATPLDDQNSRFAASIVATLKSFGTDDTSIGILANIAVARGDYLRLNLNTPNTGRQGGGFKSDTPGDRNVDSAGFPNGRRVGDDVIDTELFLINNRQPLSDNVNANDVAYRNTFPFFAPPHQPFPAGTTDDRTRN
ncbi:MAG TPA: DUF4331 family protein [Pyrinomonadaceae bacterium]|nr:DUF4331 family protein [Pyrinomonadaceae bacterium]